MSSLYPEEKQPSLYEGLDPVKQVPVLNPRDKKYIAGVGTLSEEYYKGGVNEERLPSTYAKHLQMTEAAESRLVRQEQSLLAREHAQQKIKEQMSYDYIEQKKNPALMMGEVELLDYIQQDPKDYALEDGYVKSLRELAGRDPDWAAVVDNIDNKDVLDRKEDEEVKASILRNKLAVLEARADIYSEENPVRSIADSVGNFFTIWADEMLTEGTISVGKSYLERARKLRNENLTPDQYAAEIDAIVQEIDDSAFILGNEKITPEVLTEISEIDQDRADFRDYFSYATLIPYGGAAKGAKSIFGQLRRLGGKKIAADITAGEIKSGLEGEALRASTIVDDSDEFMKASLPIKSPEDIADNVSALTSKQLVTETELVKELQEASKQLATKSLSDEEMEMAFEATKAKIEKRYKQGSVASIIPSHNSVTNTTNLTVRIGRPDGSFFSSKEEAFAYRGEKALDTSHEIVQGEAGEFYLQKQYPIDEFSYIGDYAHSGSFGTNPIKRWWLDPSSWIAKDVVTKATANVQKMGRMEALFTRELSRNMDRLGPEQQRNLEAVLSYGLDKDNGVWFSKDEFKQVYSDLTGKAASEAEWAAYDVYKQASDAEYFIRNLADYQSYVKAGYSSIGLRNSEKFNGKLYFNMGELPEGKRLRVLVNGVYSLKTRESVKKLYDEGYVLVERQKVKTHNGAPVRYEAYKRVDVTENPLDYVQVPYRPGGHRAYTGKYFVSQRRRGKFDDGSDWEMPLITTAVSGTKKEALAYVKRMESARLAFNKFNDITEGTVDELQGLYEAARKAIANTRYGTMDRWVKAIDEGEIQPNEAFYHRFDRELDVVDAGVEDFRGNAEMYKANADQSGMYYAQRGDRLLDVHDQPAAIVNPFRAQSDAIANAIKHASWDQFRQAEVKRWVNAYKDILEPGSVSMNASPEEILRRGTYRQAVDPKLMDQAESMRQYLKFQMRVPTWEDQVMSKRVKQVAESLEGIKGAGAAQRFLIDKTHSSPAVAMRSFIYDLHMGLYAFPQMALQAQTIVSSVALSPRHGLKATLKTPLFRMALINDNPRVVDSIADLATKTLGMDKQEFLDSVNQFRAFGYHNVGETLSTLDAAPHTFFNRGSVRRGAAKFLRYGRFFAQEGERYSRIVAYNIAREEAKEAGMDMATMDAKNFILKRSSDLVMGVNSSNNLLWQRGIAAVPTQFWSYQVKLLSAMMPKVLGGSKNFTGAEKARLVFGNFVAYGAAGVPLGTMIAEKYFEETGEQMNPVMYRQITTGIYDAMLYAASEGEIDVTFGNVAGTGSFWNMLYDNMMDKPLTTVLGGVIGQDIGRAAEALGKYSQMYSIAYEPEPIDVARASFGVVKEVISSARTGYKAWFAWNYGKILSNIGTVSIGDVSKGEAWLMAIANASPRELSDTYQMIDKNSSYYKNNVQESVRILNELRLRWLLTEDEVTKEDLSRNINSFVAVLAQQGGGFHDDVVKEAARSLKSWTDYERAYMRYKERGMRGATINENIMPREEE